MTRTTRAVIAVLVIVGAGVAALAVRTAGPHADRAPSAVDVGFAQDMTVHHQQAVLMAAYTREHAASPDVRALAGAIDSAQQREIGQLVGWLQSWGRPIASEHVPMAWMGMSDMRSDHHSGPGAMQMPGMATPAELDELVNLTGRALDIRFLQLMTRHHQGGLPMAEYAALHARLDFVRDTARAMIRDQQREIDQMITLLEARKAAPLRKPA